jgi:hypothetical protein
MIVVEGTAVEVAVGTAAAEVTRFTTLPTTADPVVA